MSKLAGLFCVLSVILLNPCAFADIVAIQSNSLPQEVGILASLKDVAQLEPYSHNWTQNWKYPIAKTEVAAHLAADLASLSSAIKAHPDNLELLLLTGLVARYAYNVDVPKSHDASIAVLTEAEKLNPADVRPSWFRATLQCQTMETKHGADEFLAIESSHPWDRLPAAFWLDYMECATVTNMPAHILRAGDHLQKLHSESQDGNFLLETAQKRFNPFDPKKEYAQKDIWEYEKTGSDITFTSTSCGLRMHARGDWAVDQLVLSKGSCVADFSTGPYKETGSKMRPSILVMVQQPTNNQTVEEYSKHFLTKGTFAPSTPSRCPADHCIAMNGTIPGGYGKDGDGHAQLLVFERPQPEFPGLVFESPSGPPKDDGSTGAKYYRPNQTQQRIPGKLYYVVLLDTAASIDGPASKDFEEFLQQLIVE